MNETESPLIRSVLTSHRRRPDGQEHPIQGPRPIPQTLKEVNLPGRIRASGATNLQDVGRFFVWEPIRCMKGVGDFTKQQPLGHGSTRNAFSTSPMAPN